MSVYGQGPAPATPLAMVAPRPRRYWSGAAMYFLLVPSAIGLALGAWLAWSCADAWVNGTWASATRPFMYGGLVIGVVFSLMAAWSLVLASRPRLTIRAGTLRIPRGAFGITRIAAGDVSGIGLEFKLITDVTGKRLGVGWYLTIWPGAGTGEQTGIAYVPMVWRSRGRAAEQKFLVTPAATVGRGFSVEKFDPAAQTDLARLASTYPARVARDLYQVVLSLQGAGGLLAATEQQKHVRPSDRYGFTKVLAVWSPDGVMTRPGQ